MAVVLAMASTRNVDSWGPLIPVVRRMMDIMRAFPELIIALFLIFVLGSSPVPAMIAVAFHTAGALGKLFSEVNENIDRKPIEGLSACGASWLQRIRFAVMPQVAPNYLSYFLLRLEINVRASAILGFVGAGGIGQELRRTIGWGQGAGDETAAIFVLLFLTIMIIDQAVVLPAWQTGRRRPGALRGSDMTTDTLEPVVTLARCLAEGAPPSLADGPRPARHSCLSRLHVVRLRRAGSSVPGPSRNGRRYPGNGFRRLQGSCHQDCSAAIFWKSQSKANGPRDLRQRRPAGLGEVDGKDAFVDLGEGYTVEIIGNTDVVRRSGLRNDRSTATSEWRRLSNFPRARFRIGFKDNPKKLRRPPDPRPRVQVTRTKIEVHNYFGGWENFWFPFRLAALRPVLQPALCACAQCRPAGPGLFEPVVHRSRVPGNPGLAAWRVFVALFETIMMAVLGTLTAALFGLPLAFLAARNFTPSQVLRFGTRRLFDFLRGIDMLIWSLIFIRAFGLGPLTGALAIAFTDTGSLGKLFSEALENIDNRQVEGVKATGASQIQRYRFGVIPQILPVFVSQVLYYLESNTRSATVIGALGAGGIGLMLVETMKTSRDWENTSYIIILTIVVVIADGPDFSWLRRKLIEGK
jgi:phosphonate transport system permease protein